MKNNAILWAVAIVTVRVLGTVKSYMSGSYPGGCIPSRGNIKHTHAMKIKSLMLR